MRYSLPLVLLFAAPAAFAADEENRLRDVEQEIKAGHARAVELEEDADRIEIRLDGLRRKTIELAATTQTEERALSEIELTLATLYEEEASVSSRLDARREQIANSIMALQRLGLHPPDSLVAVRASPSDTVRTALLLRSVVPGLQTDLADLDRQLEELTTLRDEIAANRKAYEVRLAALSAEHEKLDDALAEMLSLGADTKREVQDLSRRNATLADEASDLKDLLRRLEEARRAPAIPGIKPARPSAPRIRSFVAARGQIPWPAHGPIVERFGAGLANGGTSKGVMIETRPSAQVIAPYDGKIVFAGPFRGYGQILIIEHSDGYHSLMAGLSRTIGAVGHWVLTGEPVGEMGRPDDGKPRLYVELRRDGQPINPSPWLAVLKSRESG